jgi:hypothetical protein
VRPDTRPAPFHSAAASCVVPLLRNKTLNGLLGIVTLACAVLSSIAAASDRLLPDVYVMLCLPTLLTSLRSILLMDVHILWLLAHEFEVGSATRYRLICILRRCSNGYCIPHQVILCALGTADTMF